MLNQEELQERLSHLVAGETVEWGDFERYLTKASPVTLSTLMKAVKVEAYLAATQDKVLSPGMKIAIGVIFSAAIVITIIYLIVTSGGV